MGQREIKAIEYVCDGCGKTEVIPAELVEMELPEGLSGTVTEITGLGGGSAKWRACSRRCVGKAVATAMDREFAGPDER